MVEIEVKKCTQHVLGELRKKLPHLKGEMVTYADNLQETTKLTLRGEMTSLRKSIMNTIIDEEESGATCEIDH